MQTIKLIKNRQAFTSIKSPEILPTDGKQIALKHYYYYSKSIDFDDISNKSYD